MGLHKDEVVKSVAKDIDVLIVGAGVLGLSIGIALLKSQRGITVKVIDKEASLGLHASGRNSGVLHAGFYYSPDSLKSRFCRNGNIELKDLCTKYQIPVFSTGKVVLSRNEEEDSRLDLLCERGNLNQVPIEILPGRALSRFEPLAQTYERFLWSPSTAIADPIQVLGALREEFELMQGKIGLNTKVALQVKHGEIIASHHPARVIVNAAGVNADKIARSIGIASNYAMVPFMGVYSSIPKRNLPLRTLVYPVPHPVNPFLGVHLTLTTSGKVKIGPTAIPVLGREQYSIVQGWSVTDAWQAFRATRSIVAGEFHSFREIIRSEFPKLFQANLIREASTLVPLAKSATGWNRMSPGIRSQLVNTLSGELEQDFIVQTHGNSVHVLNSVSPGWTSSLSFGRWIAEKRILPLL